MQDITLSAKSYLDFAGLGNLKARAKRDDAAAAQEVGQQFEAMFVQMIFKSMREANAPMKSDLMGSSSIDTFEQMYHEELSQVMAQQGTFGMGKWLSDQVTARSSAAKAIEAYEQTPMSGMPLQNTATATPMTLDRGAATPSLPLTRQR
ncbi:rod-binding protein [Porticoccaceae bacterium]|nr:rod-binding protein [bacterium]MDC0088696.1 rod-binding protein [Porticoccaceae bacterium]